MNNYFDANIKLIKDRFPETFDAVMDNVKILDYSEVTFIDGMGRQVPAVSLNNELIQLDMLTDNTIYLDKWYDNLTNDALSNIYILYGFGNGMYVRRILRDAKENDRIFVYEPDSFILNAVISQFDMTDIFDDARFNIVINDLTEFRTAVINSMDYSMIKTANTCIYPNYEVIYADNVSKYVEVLHEMSIRMMLALNAVYGDARLRFENILKNSRNLRNSKSILDLAEKIDKSIPVIVVAAGPSLNKNADLLNEAKGRSIIVCVDSAIGALMKRDIIPDFILSADAKKKKSHFADERVKNISGIGFCQSAPHVFGEHKNNYFVMETLKDFFISHNLEIFNFDTEGSVANAAFSCFAALGFKNIILIGQDLALTDDLDHADGVINDVPEGHEDVYCYVEGINGKQVKTVIHLRNYIKEFEKEVKSHPDIHVVDATEGGAKIDGTEIITFREAIDKYCIKEINIKEIEKQTKDLMNEKCKLDFTRYFDEIIEAIEKIKKDMISANDVYRKVIKEIKTTYNLVKIKNLFAKADSYIKNVEKQPALKYVELMNNEKGKEIQKEVNVVKQSEKEEMLASVTLALDFNDSLLEAAGKAVDLISEYRYLWGEG